MGRTAVEIVLSERREDGEAFSVDVPPVLIMRDSTSLPHGSGA